MKSGQWWHTLPYLEKDSLMSSSSWLREHTTNNRENGGLSWSILLRRSSDIALEILWVIIQQRVKTLLRPRADRRRVLSFVGEIPWLRSAFNILTCCYFCQPNLFRRRETTDRSREKASGKDTNFRNFKKFWSRERIGKRCYPYKNRTRDSEP